ncbi:MAG: hypothetical protein ACYS0G_10910 [Planctomycetota bacterium]
MSGSEWGYWLFWVFGTLLVGLCLVLTWWGLFGDRARGRRRCPRCWYDLSHSPGMTCPECGYTALRERNLFRTRRRWVPALAAALAAALAVSWAIEQGRQSGWVSMLPTRVILLSLPLVGGGDSDLINELISRTGPRLTDGQWRALIKRCLRGDWRARPVTEPWRKKYGLLLDLGRKDVPDDLGLDRALLELPAWVDVQAPRPWPEGTPVCLELQVRDWWPQGTECRVRLTPTGEGASPVTVYRAGAGRSNRWFPLVVDPSPASSLIRLEALVQRRGPSPSDGWDTVQEQTITVPVDIAGKLSETLRPVRADEGLDEAVRATFRHGVVKWPTGRSPVRVRFDPRETYRPAFDDVAIGASIELHQDGTLARRLDIWWLAGTDPLSGRGVGWLVDYEDEPLVKQANETDGRWQMVVRGDPLLALRAGSASRYWDGEFTVPLEVEQRTRPAPPKDWWYEEIEGLRD